MRPAVAICVFLALAGCSTRLVVEISGDLRRPVFTPERRAGPVCLSSLTLQRGLAGSEDRPIWRIEGRNGQCVRFSRLAYGEAPDGFIERIPAAPLEAGVVYSATGRGDIRGPLGAIWIGGGAYVFDNGAWRAVEP